MKYYIKYNGKKLNKGKAYNSEKEALHEACLICCTYGYMPQVVGENK